MKISLLNNNIVFVCRLFGRCVGCRNSRVPGGELGKLRLWLREHNSKIYNLVLETYACLYISFKVFREFPTR